MRLAILTAVLLTGCAGIPAEQASNMQLCRYTLYGNSTDQAVAGREAQRRGLDCRPYFPALVQQRAAQDAALSNAAQYFNRPAPPIRRPLDCTSRMVGNQVQTTCD